MRLLYRSLWSLPLALLLVAGCDSQPTLDTPDLNGRYVGFGGGYGWAVDLAQTDGALTGTGTLTTDDAAYPLAVEGAYTFPVVGFSLDAEGLGRFTFDGRVTNEGDVLTGTMTSADGFEAEMSFQRQ